MATIRSFDKPFELVDYTQELQLIPNKWGLINELGIFRPEPVAQHSINVESREGTLGLITDQVRGARSSVNKDDTRKIRSFAVPYFPVDDYVTPADVQGKRAYGTADGTETKDAVIARKLERLRMNHAITLEAARAQAITAGTTYAPNGTVSDDYYTSFGITRKSVDFVLGTSTTDVVAKFDEVVSHIMDNALTGDVVSGVIVLASPGWFTKLIAHSAVKEAFKYYQSSQEPLRNRLGSGLYRRFIWQGVEVIEYRGSYNGTNLITTNKAYAIPTGTMDTFVTYFSPANKFSHVNTLGEEVYVFSREDSSDEKITLESESSHLSLVRRPAVSVELTSSN